MNKFKVCCMSCAAVGVIGLLSAGSILAEVDKGPADMILESTIDPAKKPKPAFFPHSKHQKRLSCDVCHHGKDEAGKRVDYIDGQKIEKCQTCHNSKETMPKKLATFKKAAHERCRNCHKSTAKDLAKCSVCHKKKE